MPHFVPTDDEVRKVYAVLIEGSWEAPETFYVLQEAWKLLARDWGIAEIKDNGHGHVIRSAG